MRQLWEANYPRYRNDTDAAATCRCVYRLIRSAAVLDMRGGRPLTERILTQLSKTGIAKVEYDQFAAWLQSTRHDEPE